MLDSALVCCDLCGRGRISAGICLPTWGPALRMMDVDLVPLLWHIRGAGEGFAPPLCGDSGALRHSDAEVFSGVGSWRTLLRWMTVYLP